MSEIKLNEITSGTTIKEMVEIINSNFTKIVESGGGPTGVPGEDGVAGPEGKRGNGIFVIKDESEIDEGKEYEKEVNEFLKNDSSDSEEGKYKEGDCIIYKSGLYIVKISPDDDNTLVAEYMGTLKGEKGDKGDTGSNEEEGGSSNQWDVIGIDGNHYGYQFNGDYKFLIIGSGIDENKLGSYGAENDYNHSLWILDGEKGIALYGKEDSKGQFSKGTITLSSDDKLMLTGARGVCVGDLIIDGVDIKHIGDENNDENFLNLICYNGDGKNDNTSIELSDSILLNATRGGSSIQLYTTGEINITTPGGEIVVDKKGIKLSDSGKSINVGAAALKGYDVDIVGKTYISGDLVVEGNLEVRTGTMYEIGDIRLWYGDSIPDGWFSNYEARRIYGHPIQLANGKGDVTYTSEDAQLNYTTLCSYNSITPINEIDFSKCLTIGKFITKTFGKNENNFIYKKDPLNGDYIDFTSSDQQTYMDGRSWMEIKGYEGYFNGSIEMADYYVMTANNSGYRIYQSSFDEKSILIVFLLKLQVSDSIRYKQDMEDDLYNIWQSGLDGRNSINSIIEDITFSNEYSDIVVNDISVAINNEYSSHNIVTEVIQNFSDSQDKATIIITNFEDKYICDPNEVGKETAKYIITASSNPLPDSPKEKFKYIMKYENISSQQSDNPTVGTR